LNQKFSPALPHKYNSVISMEATELATADSLLKLVDRLEFCHCKHRFYLDVFREEIKPVQEGVRKIQAGATHVRKEGVIRNGSDKVKC
jgi:hypothetical protein